MVIIGPAWPLRGGLATFDQRLAKQFIDEGMDCSIYSFSLQYPSFLFPGKTQYSSDPAPAGLEIHSVINSINPLNWIMTGARLKKLIPADIVVAVTGLASPGGSETEVKPVGTMFIHILFKDRSLKTTLFFEGSPDEIIAQSIEAIGALLLEELTN